jgi:hypothetical protein
LILEKNRQIGGNLQTFVRNKCIFDTGVHYLGGLAKGQPLWQLFQYLGLGSLELQAMDSQGFDRIHFEGDPVHYPIAQGFTSFIQQLSAYFPTSFSLISIIDRCGLSSWFRLAFDSGRRHCFMCTASYIKGRISRK